MCSRIRAVLLLATSWLAGSSSGLAQFAITGVTDRAIPPYENSVTFTVGTLPGYSYAAFLNGERIPLDVPVTAGEPDFYQIHAFATNATSGIVSTQWVRFLVEATERNNTEWGIPRHTPSLPIPSAAAEFVGASLRIIAPEDFPAGFEIPVVAWVINGQGHAVRVNGSLEASGHPSVEIKRGVGSGFLAANNPAGNLAYAPRIKGVQANRAINIEPGAS
jgi:hypothetical protein